MEFDYHETTIGQIYKFVQKQGKCTGREISDAIPRSSRQLTRIIKQGYVGKTIEDGVTYYVPKM